MAGNDWTRERAAIDAGPDGSATRPDAQATFYGQPEELVDSVNSLRLFVSEQTEVDRTDPNLPRPSFFAPAVPDQASDTAVSAPVVGTPDEPLANTANTAHDGPSASEPPRADEPPRSDGPSRSAEPPRNDEPPRNTEPPRNIEPPTVILPVPPPPRAFLPRAMHGKDAWFIAWRFARRAGWAAVAVLAILGAGDLISRLEDAFASSPEPQPAAAVATAAPAATPAAAPSPQPAPAAIAPAPAPPAPATPPPAPSQPTGLKAPAAASTPARAAAVTRRSAQPALASQTSGTAKANPQNTANRPPATASATTPRAAAAPTAATRAAAPAARFVGTLRVGSQPTGAAVSINGKPIGVTPITIEQQRAGSLALQITLEGFERWSAAIQVPAGRVTQVNATLRPTAP